MRSCPQRWHSLPQSGRGGPKRSAFYHEDMRSCPKRWHSLPQSGRGGPKRSAFYHEDMRSCPKRWHSLPQSGRPVRTKPTHARHLEGVRSPSSILFAFWGRPGGTPKRADKTRHFRHLRRHFFDTVGNSDGKVANGTRVVTKGRWQSWYFRHLLMLRHETWAQPSPAPPRCL